MKKVNLVAHFNEQLFKTDLKATDKQGILEELVNLIVENKFIRNSEIVLEMVRQREKLGSTGIGKGVAIPHGRTTATSEVIIAFGRTDTPVDFDAIDKKPVNLFFMVIAPPNDSENTYLPILGTLVTTLSHAETRKKLTHVQSYQEFLGIFTEKIYD
ncbi:PTS sugar transporter subunit IIA [candidate division KSB1 bacterium]|nr:PTS sugar transporter subunit IIA [candidate division KSB1 bacterium]